jgi:hypothetical protein
MKPQWLMVGVIIMLCALSNFFLAISPQPTLSCRTVIATRGDSIGPLGMTSADQAQRVAESVAPK